MRELYLRSIEKDGAKSYYLTDGVVILPIGSLDELPEMGVVPVNDDGDVFVAVARGGK